MAHLDRSAASLRIIGDALIPDEITTMLGAPPTSSQVNGETLIGKNTGIKRIAKFGKWQMDAGRREPEDLDGQIEEILGKLTDDLDVWSEIGKRFEVDCFCGLFMVRSNEGLSISPRTMASLGQRGIELGLDIYGSNEDVEDV
jgi:hypothetical protein